MNITVRFSFCLALAAVVTLPACIGDDNNAVLNDAEYQRQAIVHAKEFIQANLDDLAAASAELQQAAPAPDADGWNATADKAAVDAMKAAWKKARKAYERIEGAIAVLFPELDVSTDGRYDGFVAVAADDDLFDDSGVTGVHAIERILWSDSIPPQVVAFEQRLPGYKAAAFPSNQHEASEFKDKLCARLVTETREMQSKFRSLALDAPAAYRGVIGSMREQVEKLSKAATGEEESRYAQYTLADMRENVAAGKETYHDFQGWVLTKGDDGKRLDAAILAGFGRLDAGYSAIQGDALPPVPEGWTSANPTQAQLDTAFGKLFSLVHRESDDKDSGALVHSMLDSAQLLGIGDIP